jgi:methyl-accepting chemotaxis protein
MFKNLKIGAKIGVGFFLILAMVATLVVITRDRLVQINGIVERVVNDRNVKVQQAGRLTNNINEAARAIRNIVLVKDPAQEKNEAARVDAVRDRQKAILDTLQASITSEEGKRLLGEVIKARSDYAPLQAKVVELALADKDTECVHLMFGDFRKHQNLYMQAIDTLVAYQTQLASNDGKAAADMASSMEQLLVLLGLGMLAVSVLVGWYITRSITRPIGEAIAIADQIARGRTDVAIVVDSTDETGLLKAALHRMVDPRRRHQAPGRFPQDRAGRQRLPGRRDRSHERHRRLRGQFPRASSRRSSPPTTTASSTSSRTT